MHYKTNDEKREREGSILPKTKEWDFPTKHASMTQVLTDHDLASLGDAYVNFVYSLALSNKRKRPVGIKVRGTVLAAGLRKAGLRQYLPSRMARHELSNAAESLMVYAWLNNHVKLGQALTLLQSSDDPTENFARLLDRIRRTITFP